MERIINSVEFCVKFSSVPCVSEANMLLIDDLLLLPAKGFMGIIRKIRDMALEELEDTPEKLQRELLDAQMMLDAGEIIEKEYQEKENNILQRLSALKGK